MQKTLFLQLMLALALGASHSNPVPQLLTGPWKGAITASDFRDDRFTLATDSLEVCLSFDRGRTWLMRTSPIKGVGLVYSVDSVLIVASKPFMFRSEDTGKTWKEVLGFVRQGGVKPQDYLHLKAVGGLAFVQNFTQTGASIDNGRTWYPAGTNGGLGPMAIKGDEIILANNLGIFHSQDSGKSWISFPSKVRIELKGQPARVENFWIGRQANGYPMFNGVAVIQDKIYVTDNSYDSKARLWGGVFRFEERDSIWVSLFNGLETSSSGSPDIIDLGRRVAHQMYSIGEFDGKVMATSVSGICVMDPATETWKFFDAPMGGQVTFTGERILRMWDGAVQYVESGDLKASAILPGLRRPALIHAGWPMTDALGRRFFRGSMRIFSSLPSN